ncbi:MAG: hypothetical protein V4773_09815 [Verrucomicrobiota bacterium]
MSKVRDSEGAARWRGLRAAVCLLGLLASSAAGADRIVPDFAALARQAAVALPPPPRWVPMKETRTWTIDDVRAELSKFTDTPPRVNMLRSQLLRPDHRWLVDFKGWFRSVQKPLKIRFQDQVWDCDDYANCFVAFADLLGLKDGESRGALCVGWATVYYRKAFGGIRAGGAHAIVMVGTADGLYVLDPQDGALVSLRDFPNRDTIEEVNF